jgi:hypothetical protein
MNKARRKAITAVEADDEHVDLDNVIGHLNDAQSY